MSETGIPDVSVSIVNFHADELLFNCLRSLLDNPTRFALEVIVVDNESRSELAEKVKANFPQVQLVRLPGNEGYTRAMNLGLKKGSGRYLMQLNPDTLVQAGMVDELVAFMDSHLETGICTPRVMNRDGSLQRQCRRSAGRAWDAIAYFSRLSQLFPRSRFFGGYLMTYRGEDETHEAEAVSGSCMLIRREVVAQIGYLDESYFAYQEDSDFCFRAREAGWKIYYVPAARLIHYGGQGGSRVEPYQAIYHWHRSYFLYYRRHLASGTFFLVNWLMYLLMALKLVANLAVNFFRREKIVGTPKPD